MRDSGTLLWQFKNRFGNYWTTHNVQRPDGKQYVAILSGVGRLGWSNRGGRIGCPR